MFFLGSWKQLLSLCCYCCFWCCCCCWPWLLLLITWHLESVKDGPRKIHLKFCQNWVSNSWDIPDMGGLQSHFHVQPSCSVEVVLRCRWGCDNFWYFKGVWGRIMVRGTINVYTIYSWIWCMMYLITSWCGGEILSLSLGLNLIDAGQYQAEAVLGSILQLRLGFTLCI